jgi:hypothetical protein
MKNKGGRPSGAKTRCSGAWTEARYRSFIKGNLRRTTMKWGPIGECLKNARVRRGIYLCNICKEEIPASIKTLVTLKSTGKTQMKRVKNAIVDHTNPIIDPEKGWVSWDDCIERMFCEVESLQCVCKSCHDAKSLVEKEATKARKKREKDNAKALLDDDT